MTFINVFDVGGEISHEDILLNIVLFHLCEVWNSWIGSNVFVFVAAYSVGDFNDVLLFLLVI